MKIRVLHILETLGPGGVEKRRLLLAKYLEHAQYEQKVICSKTRGPLADAIREAGVEVISIGRLDWSFKPSLHRKVLRIIKNYKPHIIHGAVFEGVTLATVSGFLGSVPIIIAEETSDPQNRSWRGSLLLKFLLSFADYVVAISPSVINYLNGIGVASSKLKLINNGVEVSEPAAPAIVSDLKIKLGIKDNDFVIGSVGRLHNFHKRFSDLILAIVLLKDVIPNAKLLIIGYGPDEKMLQDLAQEKGVGDKVIFAGYQYELSAYYQCMDVFALASHMEGFGLVLAEAMLFKLPVVVSNVGGMRDVVLPDVTGFLVPRHSPESFALAIQKLYNDPALCKRMGEAGCTRAIAEYSAQAYVKKVNTLYAEALQKKSIKHT